jgi:hypothetical protein
MRSVSVLAAVVIIGASAMTTACGQQQAGSSPGGTAGTTSSGSAAAACGKAAPLRQDRIITLSARDNGRSLCITRGTGVLIYLKGTPAVRWKQLRSSSDALVPRANGHLMLMLGVTGGSFVADHQGVAVISSTRNPCGPPVPPPTVPPAAAADAAAAPGTAAAPGSGRMLCSTIESFRVTLTVVG